MRLSGQESGGWLGGREGIAEQSGRNGDVRGQPSERTPGTFSISTGHWRPVSDASCFWNDTIPYISREFIVLKPLHFWLFHPSCGLAGWTDAQGGHADPGKHRSHKRSIDRAHGHYPLLRSTVCQVHGQVCLGAIVKQNDMSYGVSLLCTKEAKLREVTVLPQATEPVLKVHSRPAVRGFSTPPPQLCPNVTTG